MSSLSAAAKEMKSRWQRRYNPLRVDVHERFPSLQPGTNAYPEEMQPWRKGGSSKLVVLIPGLNSSPLAWSSYLDPIANLTPTISCFVPFVLNKGYCKVEEAARPILAVVQHYATQYPDNPIVLVGHSNGARIAAYVEQKVEAKEVRLVSIAGPHGGSRLIDWTNSLGLTKLFGIDPGLAEELTYDEGRLEEWQRAEREDYARIGKNVTRLFIASRDDWRVFPIETSLPKLPNSCYEVVEGESHVTIIDAVRDRVLSYLNVPL